MKIKIIIHLLVLSVLCHISASAANWGCALEFDGNDDYAVIPVFTAAPSGNAAYTMEAWINILKWRDYYNGVDWYNGFIISRGAEGPLSGNHLCLVSKHIGLTHWARDTDTQYPVELDRWYHVSATWDGANESLYINGDKVWTKSFSPLSVGGGTLTFGKHDNVAGYWFCGQLDEVRIWTYARSQEQIKSTCLSKVDPNTPGLAGYWNFDELDGQTLRDSSPNENHGTLGPTSSPEQNDPKHVCSTLPLTGDFIPDFIVNSDDLAAFCTLWLTQAGMCPDHCTGMDLNHDGFINLPDFALFARHWTNTLLISE